MQRDVNIALFNELALLFKRMGVESREVFEAAGTKWNFLPFRPGLVGGHCIGVDPYYLAQKAQEAGYHPEIILAGRRLNDSMGEYVASQIVKLMIRKNVPVKGAQLLMMGITFKENCPDVRNTKIVDVVRHLKEFGIEVTIFDPSAESAEVKHEYGVETVNALPSGPFDVAVVGVAHEEFLDVDYDRLLKENSVLYDIKGILGAKADGKL